MAKRITAERVKKWSIATGLVGIPVVIGLIWFMVFLGSIEVTGFSGDIVCDGTEDDICMAFINFTVKEDVFLYPSEEWSETAFYTDKQPKSVRMYRSWNYYPFDEKNGPNDWREIKMNQSCKGTWCGLSSSKDERKFSFAFREGKNYSIKFEVLKYSPKDTIKWGFGPVDPYFYGREDNELNYLENNMLVEITDALDSPIGMVTLRSHKTPTTPYSISLADSKTKPVMWYQFNFLEQYNNGLGEPKFINLKNNQEIEKNYTYLIGKITGYQEVDGALISCEDVEVWNGTQQKCIYEQIEQPIFTWKEIQNLTIPTGDYMIGLKVNDLYFGESIDIVWEIAGKYLTKHAFVAVTDTPSPITENDGSDSLMQGVKINTNFNLTDINFTKHSSMDTTRALIMYKNETIISTVSFVGDIAVFPGVVLTEDTDYILACDSSGGSHTKYRTTAANDYPPRVSGTNMDFFMGYHEGQANNGNFTRGYCITSVTTTELALPTCLFKGTVKDSSGTAINNARIVIVESITDTFIINASTNSTGHWSLNVNQDGNFSVYAYQPGNKTRPGDIKTYVECVRV